MGVFASYCQVCGLPVHHDHYVPMEEQDRYTIYRGEADYESAVSFGPEHTWLKAAVAVRIDESQSPNVLFGEIHDGDIETKNCSANKDDHDVGDGIGDRAALHQVCWEMADKPELWNEDMEYREWPEIKAYQQQLFDFESFIEDGKAWMLVDPRLSSEEGERNRKRILEG